MATAEAKAKFVLVLEQAGLIQPHAGHEGLVNAALDEFADAVQEAGKAELFAYVKNGLLDAVKKGLLTPEQAIRAADPNMVEKPLASCEPGSCLICDQLREGNTLAGIKESLRGRNGDPRTDENPYQSLAGVKDTTDYAKFFLGSFEPGEVEPEPVAEEPVAEEPVAEEPVAADEPVAEEPVAEEPVVAAEEAHVG